MTEIYLALALLLIGFLLEWLCESPRIRRHLGLALIMVGIALWSTLGVKRFLHLDGAWWGWALILLGSFLLSKRAKFFDRSGASSH